MILEKIAGRFVTHEGQFNGTVTIDRKTGLIKDVSTQVYNGSTAHFDGYICPGFVDIHVHCREDQSGKQNYKEDYDSAAHAAINGGVVCVGDMPNNPIAPTTEERFKAKLALTTRAAIPVMLYAGVGPGSRPFRDVPYKVFMEESVGDLFFPSFEELNEILRYYTKRHIAFHTGDQKVLDLFKNESRHERRRPAEGEMSGIDEAIRLTECFNLSTKLCHCSICGSLHKIEAARKRGLKITCEVTPTHLYFDTSMLEDMSENRRALLQMNPPLRTATDRMNMIEALRSGVIDYLASDHAPHTLEEKMKPGGTSGLTQLDTDGHFATWLIAEHGFSIEDVVRVCSYNPGAYVNQFLATAFYPQELGKGFGRIEPGYVASFTVLDLNNPLTIKRCNLKTRAGWSPFEGETFPGRVSHTIIKGVVYATHNARMEYVGE